LVGPSEALASAPGESSPGIAKRSSSSSSALLSLKLSKPIFCAKFRAI